LKQKSLHGNVWAFFLPKKYFRTSQQKTPKTGRCTSAFGY
jgi:hypothetical protein